MSVINEAVEAVMTLVNGMNLFSAITRGALSTSPSLTCEVAPSSPSEVYLDKNKYIPLDLTINGKHSELETLSEALNTIHETLTMKKEYPTGDHWQIVDISTYTEPQVIDREDNNDWLMASSLTVNIKTELGE